MRCDPGDITRILHRSKAAAWSKQTLGRISPIPAQYTYCPISARHSVLTKFNCARLHSATNKVMMKPQTVRQREHMQHWGTT